MNTIVIGDIHGNPEALISVLRNAGVIFTEEEGGEWKRAPGWRVIQIGDLLNMAPLGNRFRGFLSDDYTTLKIAQDFVDEITVGNHEIFWTHPRTGVYAGRWQGMAKLHELDQRLLPLLRKTVRDGKYVAATEAHGFLITHAGLHPSMWQGMPDSAAVVAEWLNDWLIGLETGESNISQASPFTDMYYSIFWYRPYYPRKWSKMPFRQICGHTPDVEHPKRYRGGSLTCIDNAGYLPGIEFKRGVAALVRREGSSRWTTVFGAPSRISYVAHHRQALSTSSR